MTDTHSILNYAEAILAAVKELIGKMRAPMFAPGRPRAALFLTIAEQFEASILLGRVGMGTHGAVHVRSMLEALVSMNLLATNTGYVDQMRFEKLRGEKNLYERLLSNPAPPPPLSISPFCRHARMSAGRNTISCSRKGSGRGASARSSC